MALQYPHVDVLGFDLAPVPLKESQIPPNCHFEIRDANGGLDTFHGQFDLISIRMVVLGVSPQVTYRV